MLEQSVLCRSHKGRCTNLRPRPILMPMGRGVKMGYFPRFLRALFHAHSSGVKRAHPSTSRLVMRHAFASCQAPRSIPTKTAAHTTTLASGTRVAVATGATLSVAKPVTFSQIVSGSFFWAVVAGPTSCSIATPTRVERAM